MSIVRAVFALLLVLVILLGAGCASEPTAPPPTETEPVSIPTRTHSVTSTRQPPPVAPTVTPLTPTPTTDTGVSPSPTPPSPSPSLTRVPPTAAPTLATPVPTPLPTPGSIPYLALPLYTPLMRPPPGQPDIPLVGATALAVHPNYPASPYLAAGTQSNGVLISQNGGVDWEWRTAGLPQDATIVHLAVAPGELAAVTTDGAAYRSQDSQGQWQPIAGLQDGVGGVVFSPSYEADGTVFAIRNNALLRSADRGESWTMVLAASACPLNVAFSPGFPADSTAFAPRCDHLVRSVDAGLSWVDVPLEAEGPEVGHFMNLQVVQDRLLAQGNTQGLPVYSDDGGRSWNRAYDPEQAPFAVGSLWDVVSLAPDGTYYAAGRSHMYDSVTTVWRTDDGGGNWYPVARTSGVGRLVASAAGALWLATPEGVFFSGGNGWRLLHPGGSQPELVGTSAGGVALTRRGVSKYTSQIRLFEQHDGQWQPVFEETTNKAPRRAFPSPNYPDEQSVLILGQDYGGSIWAMALRLQSEVPLVEIDQIPAGPGYAIDQYSVRYADDYPTSGRIELRHGYSGALYISDDRGHTWTRPDSVLPGACERNPVSGFGALWFANADVRNRLLCPLGDEQPYSGTVQPFEWGELLLLDPIVPSTYRQIYALIPDWAGGSAWGTLPHYESAVAPPPPPSGLLAPDPAFHTAWVEGYCCRPDSLPAAEALGWATDAASSLEVALQHFEGGTMIWRGDRDEILVLVQSTDRDSYSVWPD
jgi:photosystem II stability/assembly factor-like uncharacterized protein